MDKQQDYGMRIDDPKLGRFLSEDPLTKKNAELMPYQFASNRPIDGIDLDDLEFATSGEYFSSPDGTYRVSFTLKLSVTNASKIISDSKIITDYTSSIKNSIQKDFSGGKGTKEDPIVTTKVREIDKGEFNIKLIDAIPQIDKNGQTIGYITGKTEGDLGQTQKNKIDVAIDINGQLRAREDVGRTASHETGHAGGLRHPFHHAAETDLGVPLGPLKTWEKNLMNSYGGSRDPKRDDYNPVPSTSGHEVTPQQRKR